MYLAAAGAAGIGLTALSNAAQAKVVYTAANIPVVPDISVPIEFNHSGVADVNISYFNGPYSWGMDAYVPFGNGVRAKQTVYGSALALFFGDPIGPGGVFGKGAENLGLASCFAKSNFSACGGPWQNIGTRYLGVQFQISGQTHYGWVRIDVTNLEGTITGYAYETTPNTAIKAGSLKSSALVELEQPLREELQPSLPLPRNRSLGALALGSLGRSAWLRDDDPQK